MIELFGDPTEPEWPGVEPFIKLGELGINYFNFLTASGFCDREASDMAIIAGSIEDTEQAEGLLRGLARANNSTEDLTDYYQSIWG